MTNSPARRPPPNTEAAVSPLYFNHPGTGEAGTKDVSEDDRMIHDPKTAANEFINRGIREGKPLMHIEAQTLLYFSHGWMLGIHGRPFHNGTWEA